MILHVLKKEFAIFFILTSRFPTEKAYGVTTEYTARAVKAFGYKTAIITPSKGFRRISEIDTIPISTRFSSTLLSNNFKKLLKFRFNLFLVYYAIRISIKIRNIKNIIWSRDIFLSFLLTLFTDRKMVLEIHHKPNRIQIYMLNILSKRKQVIFAPISDFLDKKIFIKQARIINAPMSVNKEELVSLGSIINRANQIVYVGSPESVGNFINFNFLNDLGLLVLKNFPEWTINVMGFDKVYFQKQINGVVADNLVFSGLIPRSKVLEQIRMAKIGLVIYPDDNNHQFPLKIVEYAASGLAILATNTESHRRILNSNLCLFFQPNSVESAFGGIKSLIDDPSQLNHFAHNSRIWVEEFTYKNRALNMLQNF